MESLLRHFRHRFNDFTFYFPTSPFYIGNKDDAFFHIDAEHPILTWYPQVFADMKDTINFVLHHRNGLNLTKHYGSHPGDIREFIKRYLICYVNTLNSIYSYFETLSPEKLISIMNKPSIGGHTCGLFSGDFRVQRLFEFSPYDKITLIFNLSKSHPKIKDVIVSIYFLFFYVPGSLRILPIETPAQIFSWGMQFEKVKVIDNIKKNLCRIYYDYVFEGERESLWEFINERINLSEEFNERFDYFSRLGLKDFNPSLLERRILQCCKTLCYLPNTVERIEEKEVI